MLSEVFYTLKVCYFLHFLVPYRHFTLKMDSLLVLDLLVPINHEHRVPKARHTSLIETNYEGNIK